MSSFFGLPLDLFLAELSCESVSMALRPGSDLFPGVLGSSLELSDEPLPDFPSLPEFSDPSVFSEAESESEPDPVPLQ